jgi:hypothetical protein
MCIPDGAALCTLRVCGRLVAPMLRFISAVLLEGLEGKAAII